MADFEITANVSSGPKLAGLGGGEFIAVWTHATGTIRGQRFRANGQLTDRDIQISIVEEGQNLAVVSRLLQLETGFVVAWNSGTRTLMLRRFDMDGTALDNGIEVSTEVNGEHPPALATTLDGNFVVVWTHQRPDFGLRAQIFNTDGKKVGSEITVNTSPGVHFAPVATELDPGGFAVAWQGGPQSGISSVIAQVFEPDGSKFGPERVAHFSPVGTDMAMTFVGNDDTTQIGHFVVVYTSFVGGVGGRRDKIVIAALFGPTGREAETNVTHRVDRRNAGDVAVRALPGKRIIVTWSEFNPHALGRRDPNIKAMILAEQTPAPGEHILIPEIGPVLINTETPGRQTLPAVALSMKDQAPIIAIAWHDNTPIAALNPTVIKAGLVNPSLGAIT
jgi:hypothetical protein